jgi:hypothetical protein
MNIAPTKQIYSAHAQDTFDELERRVSAVFKTVEAWRGWALVSNPDTPVEQILLLVREIFRSVSWYQSHTTEAGFHMFGRLPKGEVKLIQTLCLHKADEAEHGLWAREDYVRLGGHELDLDKPASPATFAVAGVWWRMAQTEEPFGYLGAEYLFEKLTALVTQAALGIIETRGLRNEGLRFVVEHATEDVKHATLIRHLILDVATRHPGSAAAMLRCFDYFNAVYPLPVWDEAYRRAIGPS